MALAIPRRHRVREDAQHLAQQLSVEREGKSQREGHGDQGKWRLNVLSTTSCVIVRAVTERTLASGTVLDGTYKIDRLVGAGGVGEVYEASHTRLSGRYAVKVLLGEVSKREDVLKRFQREAEVTSALRHPNIVQVVDFNRLPDGTAYLVMEYLEGEELAKQIYRLGGLPLARVVDLVGQLASALAAAHSQKVIHRDLKPQNLFVVKLPGDDRELIKILDFGISKVREAATKLTRQASIIGTPQYMAPEQARGLIDEIDERTDLFALAAITYEMITGRPPFYGEAIEAILYQVVHESPPPFAQPLPAVEAVVMRGMAKNKLKRFSGVREFHHALAKAAADTTLPASVAPTLLPPEPASEVKQLEAGTTAILVGPTTLSSAASASGAEKTTERRERRWPWPVGGAVGIAGIVLALLWPRSGTPPRLPVAIAPVETVAPVATVTPVAMVDAGAPLPVAADADVKEQAPIAAPAVAKPKSRPTSKKTTSIRMEDL
jgi:serine/threonine-protein kinase